MGRIILRASIIGFVCGVAARSFFFFPFGIAVLFFLVGAALAAFFLFMRAMDSAAKKRLWPVTAFFVMGLGLGIAYYHARSLPAAENLARIKEGFIKARAVIVEESDERESYTRLTARIDEREVGGEWQAENVKVLLTVGHYPQFQFGDRIEFTGKLRLPRSSADFDWRAYLAKDDILFESFQPAVVLLDARASSRIARALFAIKSRYLSVLSRLLPEPHASFLGGLTVGAKRGIPASIQESFRKTGVIHLVVLSGYNVTIVADNIIRGLGVLALGKWLSVGGGVAGIVAFAIMTGASATVLRASIMAILVILARSTGRIYEVTIALFAAALLMIVANPRILRFDPSFQLSFLATLGLIFLAPRIERRFLFLPKRFGIREHATSTIAAQLAVLPFLLARTGTLSVVSPVTNMLILLLVPLTMLFGFLTGIVGFLSLLIAAPFAWITYGLLSYELFVVQFFSKIPFAAVSITSFSWLFALFFYGCYGILLWRPWRKAAAEEYGRSAEQ